MKVTENYFKPFHNDGILQICTRKALEWILGSILNPKYGQNSPKSQFETPKGVLAKSCKCMKVAKKRWFESQKTQSAIYYGTCSTIYQNNTNKTIKHQIHNTYVRTSSTCHYFLKSHITQSTIATQNKRSPHKLHTCAHVFSSGHVHM